MTERRTEAGDAPGRERTPERGGGAAERGHTAEGAGVAGRGGTPEGGGAAEPEGTAEGAGVAGRPGTPERAEGIRELIAEETIRRRVDQLAARISEDYADAGEIVLVGILKGAFVFLADLSRRLTIPRRIEFMGLSSYRAGSRRGGVRLILDLRTSIEGRHVLVVEDIVDSGHTLRYLLDTLRARGPASVEACALVQKPERLEVDVPLRYLGFEIPDAWVVGYGLDFDEKFRTLPYIGVLEPGGDAGG